MLVFLDFEASSLSKQSYPVEVAWIFEDGASESHLIRPAPNWTEWDPKAAAIHGISRDELERAGTPHEEVAHRMVTVLDGHDLLASAPSWDGKWLSVLLRAAGLPRHTLRLRDSDDAILEVARETLRGKVPDAELEALASKAAETEVRIPGTAPAHRALADAEEERQRWLAVREAAAKIAG